MMRGVWNALAFLSRVLPPPPTREGENPLAAAVRFYPLAGAVLGAIAALPAVAFPSAAPWLYPLLLAWLTRGLHWDGLADLADACGSNATGDRFWEILKDSRVGAFGVMALVFGITGQMAAARNAVAADNLLVLVLAPAYARAMVVVLGACTMPHPTSFLGALIQPGLRSAPARFALALTLVAALLVLGPGPFGAALVMTGASLAVIIRIARRHGGTNGDFHGAAIIASELAALVAGGI